MTDPRLDGAPAPQAGSPVRFTRPLRDKPTWLTYVQISLWAWFLYAFGATQALLRDEQGTSRSVGSLHGSAFAVGGLVGAALAAPAIRRWGRGVVLRATALASMAALLVYTWPGASPALSMTGAALAALFGTAMLISTNAFLLDHQGPAGPAALTEANALASGAGILGPLIVGLGAATVLGWRWGLWIVVIGLALLELWRGRHVLAYGTRRLARDEAAHGRFPAAVYWSLGVIMAFLSTEFSLTLWGADLLRERCGFGGAAAAASLGAVTGGMLVGRIGGSRLAERHSSESVLKGSILVALAAFSVAWSFTVWPVVLLGMFLTGVGIGVHWPMGVARVARASGGNTDRASAAASFAGGISIAIAPLALGTLSDAFGFHVAFLLVPVFLLSALAIIWFHPVPDDVVPDVVATPH
ncbi:MAG: MFS transporter [Actinomycetales bacterium]|nr:MFS transporter [Actinomycetales bacterium]